MANEYFQISFSFKRSIKKTKMTNNSNSLRKIALVSGHWGQNIGNAFFNCGAKWLLEQVSIDYSVEFIQDQPGYSTFNNQSKGNPKNDINLLKYLQTEFLVLQGPLLTVNFRNLWEETFYHLKLRIHGIDLAFLWGVITAIVALVVIVAIGALLVFLDFDLTDASNIPELELYFSLPSMLFLIAFQPIAEEVFFRGFLLEKIDIIIWEKTAIITTSILFGIAHLSVGNIYPAFTTGVIGLLLAFIVIKTKNLYSAITAHIIFNLVSFSMYIFAKSIL